MQVEFFVGNAADSTFGKVKFNMVPFVFEAADGFAGFGGCGNFGRFVHFDDVLLISESGDIVNPYSIVCSIGMVLNRLSFGFISLQIGNDKRSVARQNLMVNIHPEQTTALPVEGIVHDERRFFFSFDKLLKQPHGFFAQHSGSAGSFPGIRFFDSSLFEGIFVIRFTHTVVITHGMLRVKQQCGVGGIYAVGDFFGKHCTLQQGHAEAGGVGDQIALCLPAGCHFACRSTKSIGPPIGPCPADYLKLMAVFLLHFFKK